MAEWAALGCPCIYIILSPPSHFNTQSKNSTFPMLSTFHCVALSDPLAACKLPYPEPTVTACTNFSSLGSPNLASCCVLFFTSDSSSPRRVNPPLSALTLTVHLPSSVGHCLDPAEHCPGVLGGLQCPLWVLVSVWDPQSAWISAALVCHGVRPESRTHQRRIVYWPSAHFCLLRWDLTQYFQ